MCRSSRGFTLIEMLVALAIGAGIAGLSYQALTGIIRAEQKVTQVSQQINELDRVWQYVGADLLHAVPRAWMDYLGNRQQPLEGLFGDRLSQSNVAVANEEDYLIRFVRGSRSNLKNKLRSDLYVVGYRLTQEEGSDSKTLWRDSWAPVDATNEPTIQQRRLLDGINEMNLKYCAKTRLPGACGTGWPPRSGNADALPALIRIEIDTLALGKVNRSFILSM